MENKDNNIKEAVWRTFSKLEFNNFPIDTSILYSTIPGNYSYEVKDEQDGNFSMFSHMFLSAIKEIRKQKCKVTFQRVYNFIVNNIEFELEKYKIVGEQFPVTNGSLGKSKLVILGFDEEDRVEEPGQKEIDSDAIKDMPIPEIKKKLRGEIDFNAFSLNTQWSFVNRLLQHAQKHAESENRGIEPYETIQYLNYMVDELMALLRRNEEIPSNADQLIWSEVVFKFSEILNVFSNHKTEARQLIQLVTTELENWINKSNDRIKFYGISNLYMQLYSLSTKDGIGNNDETYLIDALRNDCFELYPEQEVQTIFQLATYYHAIGDLERAEEYFTKILEINTSDLTSKMSLVDEYYKVRAMAELVSLEIYEESDKNISARKFYRIKKSLENQKSYLIKIEPNLPTGIEPIDHLENIAKLYLNFGNLYALRSKSRLIFDMKQMPRSVIPIFLKRKMIDDAIEAYKEAINRNENLISAYIQLGILRYNRSKRDDIEKAKFLLEKAKSLDVNSDYENHILYHLGCVYESIAKERLKEGSLDDQYKIEIKKQIRQLSLAKRN